MLWLVLLGLLVLTILGIGAYLQSRRDNSEKIKQIMTELADDITFDNTIVYFHHGYISATHDFVFDGYCWTANVKYYYSSLVSKWYVLFSAVSCPIRGENN